MNENKERKETPAVETLPPNIFHFLTSATWPNEFPDEAQ